MTKTTENPYPLGAAHTYIAHIREDPPPPPPRVRLVLISSFCSKKRLRVFLPLPLPGWDASPSQGYPPVLNLPVYPILHLGGERNCENITQCPRPGLKPRQLDLETSTLTMRPLQLTALINLFYLELLLKYIAAEFNISEISS